MWFLFAIGGAICFGIRGIMYQMTSQKLLDRSLLLVGVFLTGTILSLINTFFLWQSWDKTILIGILMGVFSYLSNATLHKGYSVGKASIVAILAGMPPLVVIILAYFAWGESINEPQLISFIIIITGLIMVRYSSDISLRNMRGAEWGLLAMIFFGLNDLTTKQATLLDSPLFPTLLVMFTTGTTCALMSWIYGRFKSKPVHIPNKQKSTDHNNNFLMYFKENFNNQIWSTSFTVIFGMVIGSTNIVGMIFSLKAFDTGISGLVSAILAANVLFVMLYAGVILKDSFTKLESIGLLTSFIGLILLKVLE